MKLTKSQLKQIIKEELGSVLGGDRAKHYYIGLNDDLDKVAQPLSDEEWEETLRNSIEISNRLSGRDRISPGDPDSGLKYHLVQRHAKLKDGKKVVIAKVDGRGIYHYGDRPGQGLQKIDPDQVLVFARQANDLNLI